MQVTNLCGVFVPLVTPFDAEGNLDEAQLRRLVARLLPDVQGFVVNGTTSDFPLLSPEERARAVRIVLEEVHGQRVVIAGTGTVSTQETVAMTHTAQELGADAALVITPYYIRPSAAGLRAHFATVAAAVPDLPVLLYNFPKLVGQPIPATVIGDLYRQTDNVAGIKDSSGDMPYTLSVLEATGEDFRVFVGHGALLLPALAMGAAGGIVAAGNLVPQAYRALYEAVQANAWETAREWQSRIYPVARLVSAYGSLTVRAGLELLGMPVGSPRAPLTSADTLSADDIATLRAALEKSDVYKAEVHRAEVHRAEVHKAEVHKAEAHKAEAHKADAH